MRNLGLAGMALAVLAVSGCAQTEASRLYTLSDLPASERVTASRADLSVGVGPITLPQYLDRPQIVTRTSANQLEIAEFDRWAEPLSETVPRVLSENLSMLLGSDRVYQMPRRRRTQLDYHVEVEFTRFEFTAGGAAILTARWEVFAGDDDRPVLDGKAVLTQPGGPAGNYQAVAAALSQALGKLSRNIADGIASRAG